MGRDGDAQLSLAVYLRDDATFDNFLFTGDARPLRDTLQGQLGEGGEPFVYIHGPPGTGRSHLLQAACHHAPHGGALYLPLAQLAAQSSARHSAQEILAGVEALRLVSLDDLEAVSGREDWERALFHLINRARDGGCRLLVSAGCPPRQLAVSLPDLHSRLGWGVVFRLSQLDDGQKRRLLQFRARRRGMDLPAAAAAYILAREGRSLEQLMGLLDRLDRASIAAQRRLSIPFIREILGGQ